MRVEVAVFGALALAASSALALEPGPVSLRLGVGGVVGTGPVLDGAPGLDASLALSFGPLLGAFAGVSGWSLSNNGPVGGRTEVFVSTGATLRGPLSGGLGWALAAGPSLAIVNEAAAPTLLRPALVVAPALELGTRRPLSVRVGAQAAAFSDGLRVMGSVGFGYAF
jgi:hypothetical protein